MCSLKDGFPVNEDASTTVVTAADEPDPSSLNREYSVIGHPPFCFGATHYSVRVVVVDCTSFGEARALGAEQMINAASLLASPAPLKLRACSLNLY